MDEYKIIPFCKILVGKITNLLLKNHISLQIDHVNDPGRSIEISDTTVSLSPSGKIPSQENGKGLYEKPLASGGLPSSWELSP